MARYIDADKAHEGIEAIQTSLESNNDEIWNKNKTYYKGLAMARGVINETPTADVAPRAEVAREIFEEIEELFHILVGNETGKEFYSLVASEYAELKKKYTEGEK